MKNSYYRPDIDGLRAFAVLSVIFFHLDFEFATGGFVGVDVFFVISGFLITGIMVKEISTTGTLNFNNFYIRRIRRIFPALFVTLLATLIISTLLFSPSHLERVGGSTIYALSSLSNFYFWTEAGYFDSANDVKPLLHTWSLAIEEQFYFIWPVFLVLLMKTKNKFFILLTLVSMMMISLFLNYLFEDGHVNAISELSSRAAEFISDGRSTIFYLLPFRLYEFAIGAALVFISTYPINSKIINEIIMLLGVGFIGYPLLTFSEQTLFPSYNALAPCIGASLIIYSGNKSIYFSKLFTNKIAVWIGLISYSLYLVHWPIIVFWKYYTFETLTLPQSFLVIFTSISIAIMMYKYVEQPFRSKSSVTTKNKIITSSGFILFLCSLSFVSSANIWANKGWPWRIPTIPHSQELVYPETKEVRLTALDKKTKWTNAYTIETHKEDPKQVLILGDSHAEHLQGLAQYLSIKYDLSFTFFTFTGCPAVFGTYKVYGAPTAITKESPKQIKCRQQTKIWEEYVQNNKNKFDYVIISSRWNWLFEPKDYYGTKQRRDLLIDKSNPKFTIDDSKKVFSSFLDYTIKTIHKSGAKAIVFGQVPNAGRALEGCNNIPRVLIHNDTINKRCSHIPKQFVLQRSEFSNKTIKELASKNDAHYALPTDYFCKGEDVYCITFKHGHRLKDDADHINKYGSVYLAQEWEKSNSFPFKKSKTK